MTGRARFARPNRRGLSFASLLVVLGSWVFSGLVLAEDSLDREQGLILAQLPKEPEDYRMERYRAAVPGTLRGATVISAAQARRLRDSGTLFVDVLPRPAKPAGLPADTIWRDKPRYNIPGSVWLPNVGYGALNAKVDAYFRDNLARLTAGDRSTDLVFYCLADCWMSWNAAKRALSYNYTRVFWFPEGSDGWRAEGGDLVETAPEPIAP